jgi:hypothetical protein
MTKVERLIAIIFHSIAAMAFGFYLGQLFIIHGHNYLEGAVIFPGLVIILEFPVMYLGMKASKRKENQ